MQTIISNNMQANIEQARPAHVWLKCLAELSGKQAANAHKLSKNDLLKAKRRKI